MSFEDAIDAPEVKVRSVCAVDGCGRFVQWRQWCCTHYARWLRTGIAGGAIKPLGPRGAGHLNKQGRVMMDVGDPTDLFLDQHGDAGEVVDDGEEIET